ncbi:MAG TPA: hypothetical protein VHX42_04055, partial [Candidatus Babeliales bacterium]|nr:hypothetical protein [Candidatus Babeliales bacterium]
ITFIPFKSLMKDDIHPKKSDSYKEQGTTLFSFSKTYQNEEIKIQIKLHSDFGKMNPGHFLNQFKETPKYESGHIPNEGKILTVVKYDEITKELCEANIIRKYGFDYGYDHIDQKYEHWVKGYFADELNAEEEAIQKFVADNTKAYQFYSRLKKLFLGGSIGVIIAYLVYQKFYATAR